MWVAACPAGTHSGTLHWDRYHLWGDGIVIMSFGGLVRWAGFTSRQQQFELFCSSQKTYVPAGCIVMYIALHACLLVVSWRRVPAKIICTDAKLVYGQICDLLVFQVDTNCFVLALFPELIFFWSFFSSKMQRNMGRAGPVGACAHARSRRPAVAFRWAEQRRERVGVEKKRTRRTEGWWRQWFIWYGIEQEKTKTKQ